MKLCVCNFYRAIVEGIIFISGIGRCQKVCVWWGGGGGGTKTRTLCTFGKEPI